MPITGIDKRSIRTIKIGKHGKLLRVGCPKGSWDGKRRYCKTGMKGIETIMPRRRRYNPATPTSTRLSCDKKAAIARYFDGLADETRTQASAMGCGSLGLIGRNPSGYFESPRRGPVTTSREALESLRASYIRDDEARTREELRKYGLGGRYGQAALRPRRRNMPYNYEFGNDFDAPEYHEYAFNPELLAVSNNGKRKRRKTHRRASKRQLKYRKLVKKYGVKRAAKLWRKKTRSRNR